MREIVMALLCALPFAAIGFFGGMLFMRANYLRILRWQKRQIDRFARNRPQTGGNGANSLRMRGGMDLYLREETPVSVAENGFYEGVM